MNKRLGVSLLLVSALAGGTLAQAAPQTVHTEIKNMNALSQQQQALIPIAAFAATGEMDALRHALNAGLNQGLTINEIKSLLVQVYAYAGFPRSLNALNTFMAVLDERQSQGINDAEGKSSQALPAAYDALAQGSDNQTKLVGQPVTGALFDFAPEIDTYLKAHLFGDIFAQDVLSWQAREIATVSMLAAMTGTDSQLKSHVNISKNIGITTEQLQAIEQILNDKVSKDVSQKLTDAF